MEGGVEEMEEGRREGQLEGWWREEQWKEGGLVGGAGNDGVNVCTFDIVV